MCARADTPNCTSVSLRRRSRETTNSYPSLGPGHGACATIPPKAVIAGGDEPGLVAVAGSRLAAAARPPPFHQRLQLGPRRSTRLREVQRPPRSTRLREVRYCSAHLEPGGRSWCRCRSRGYIMRGERGWNGVRAGQGGVVLVGGVAVVVVLLGLAAFSCVQGCSAESRGFLGRRKI